VPSSAPETATAAVRRLGETLETAHGSSVTPHELEFDVAAAAPAPSEAGYPAKYVWAALRVEVCVPEHPPEDADVDYYLVARSPWSLVGEDNSLIEPSHTGYSGFPQPEYPWGMQEVGLGRCVNGWIVYAVSPDVDIVEVQYARQESTPEYWIVE
jgi:hypothetical protein